MKPYLARAERTRQSGPHGQAVCPTPPLYGAASAGGERQAPPPGVNSGAHPHIRKFTCKQKGQRVWHALTVMRTNVLNQYAKKTGHTVEEVAAWMDATSWWTAAEAKENGFIQITANDGKESTSLNATFTKTVHAASVTLAEPLTVEGDITVAVLQVTGSIPDDATFKVEVTNNANDPSPVWQDATVEVKKGVNIVFTNSEATNGAAFNFRVSVSRGASGTGGYIEAISGAFQ